MKYIWIQVGRRDVEDSSVPFRSAARVVKRLSWFFENVTRDLSFTSDDDDA